ncbi:hypothetical protein PR202_gb18066 [Eleusine coracana subsp. coracana]|uniref:Transketolase-like C-terminal domain-containing protein n=1 Tax=Eleusine coracana subsp. coracana TaxID=191504 RepID=A0AAV5F4G1_ELECO|nr:hypothetical protein PR202_gb17999 [Eleusine coracana subsp. coracana]GJN29811.1 hypothetical protein PR202_gb18066 [Eleusine coracana subsp. coracana]
MRPLGAYKVAVENRKRPSILALSRQKLPHLPGTSIEGVEKGGYVISDNSTGNKPDLIVLGTGSELEIAAKAADVLRKEGKTKYIGASGKAIGIDKFGASAPAGKIYEEYGITVERASLQQPRAFKITV